MWRRRSLFVVCVCWGTGRPRTTMACPTSRQFPETIVGRFMEEERTRGDGGDSHGELRSVIRSVIDEFMRAEQVKTEPAYQAELIDERRRREQLEHKVNELATENKRNKQLAEEADKQANVRAELQRLGVAKVDLAFRAVHDDIRRKD